MQTVRDKLGQEWVIDLDLGKLFEIDTIDFSEVTIIPISLRNPEEGTIDEIMSNPVVACVILWACVRDRLANKFMPQRDDKGNLVLEDGKPIIDREKCVVLDTDFYSLLDQPAIEEAQLALVNAIVPFFPKLRTTIPKLIEEYGKLQKVAQEEIEKGEILSDPDRRKIVKAQLKKAKEMTRQLIETDGGG